METPQRPDTPLRPFSGALTAIVSPFVDGKGSQPTLDLEAFKAIVNDQKLGGMSGIVVSGTTGESPTLTSPEKLALLEAALPFQDDRFSVYVGTGTNATESTVSEVTQFANFRSKGIGVRGIMVVTPYYNRPNQAGLLTHLTAAAKAAGPVPVCIYNVPARTGCSLAAATFAQLVHDNDNIVAIKEAAGDVLAMTALRLALRKQGISRLVTILSGDDATFPPALVAGAQGIISVTSHVIPRVISGILNAAQAGDFERVRSLHLAAYPLSQGLFCAPNPAPVKYALHLLGRCTPTVRGPLAPLSAAEQEIVQSSLHLARELGAATL
jgi:4-hydroxy-tetrahydrodipicolinate synthase